MTSDEQREAVKAEMWKTMNAKIKELPRGRCSSRSAARWTEFRDLIVLRCTYSYEDEDGSGTVCELTLRRDVRFEGSPEIKITTRRDNHDEYWQRMYDMREDGRSVIVDHKHYRIGSEDNQSFRGFGGRKFVIGFFDGRTVTSTDLWFQGPIPPSWRDRLPDNATFAPEPETDWTSVFKGFE